MKKLYIFLMLCQFLGVYPANNNAQKPQVLLKKALNSAVNGNKPFFTGRSINDLNTIIRLSQNALRDEAQLDLYRATLNKQNVDMKKSFNAVINLSRKALQEQRLTNEQEAQPNKETARVQTFPKQVAAASSSQSMQANEVQSDKGKGKTRRRRRKNKNINLTENNTTQMQATSSSSSSSGNSEEINMPFWQAAQNGNIAFVDWYLAQGLNPNKLSPGDETPLALAASNGHEEIVKRLIEAGADLDKKNLNGHTALMFAIFGQHNDITKLLIEAGADVNIKHSHGDTALNFAIQKDNQQVVRELIDAGADVSGARQTALSWGRRHLLHLFDQAQPSQQQASIAKIKKQLKMPKQTLAEAVAERNMTVVAWYLNHGIGFNASPNDIERTLLDQYEAPERSEPRFMEKDGQKVPQKNIWEAAANGDWKVIAWHMNHGVSYNAQNEAGETPLIVAAKNGLTDLLEKMIRAKFKLDTQDAKGNTALMYAVENKYVDIIDELINAGADINVKNNEGKTVLRMAVMRGMVDDIKTFIELGADAKEKDDDDYTLLMLASYLYYNQKGILPLLIDAGAEVNAQDSDGTSALMIAASRGWVESVQELLKAGADVEAVDVTGRQALDYAQNEDIKTLLRQEEAKLERARGQKSLTLGQELIMATKKNNIHEVKALLKRGANINAQNERGETALMAAARRNFIPIVQLLLREALDIELAEKTGITPLQSAVINGNIEIVKLLLDAGAQVNARDSYRGRTPIMWIVRMTKGGGPRKVVEQIPVNKSIELMNLLLHYGADPTIVDKKKTTPTKLAHVFGLRPLVNILNKATAQRNLVSYNQRPLPLTHYALGKVLFDQYSTC